jgi:hypothetical protein
VNERPAWIEKEVEDENRQQSVIKTRSLKASEHSATICKKGPKFWQDLVDNLRNNTDNLPRIRLSGEIFPVRYSKHGEQSCRVSVYIDGLRPRFTCTDIFYIPGAPAIRSTAIGNHESEFAFRVLLSGELGAIQCGVDTAPRSASQLAAFIVEGMATLVRQSC